MDQTSGGCWPALLQIGVCYRAASEPGAARSLGQGDAVTFRGDLAHGYANPGMGPARFTLAVFEPGVGTTRRPKTQAEGHDA